MDLPHRLERTLIIEAPRDVVFRFFTDPARWESWWGAGSTIDARPGGRVLIRYPGAVEAAGEVVEVDAPERIVFTYGYASGSPIAVGASLVTIALERAARGTRLTLTHDVADAAVRDSHVQGWRYQLSLFANIVTNELHHDAPQQVDAWFSAWAEPDERARREALEALAIADVRVRDRYSHIDGLTELSHHIAGAQRFMPGVRMARQGSVRHCQGMAIADWTATAADGSPRGQGTNVFLFGPDGRIEAVTGFWG